MHQQSMVIEKQESGLWRRLSRRLRFSHSCRKQANNRVRSNIYDVIKRRRVKPPREEQLGKTFDAKKKLFSEDMWV